MAKTKMQDLLVLLPGITGSVLQNDKDLWGLSGHAFWRALASLGNSLELLELPPHDLQLPPEDGIKAIRLTPSFHCVFGLVKYRRLFEIESVRAKADREVRRGQECSTDDLRDGERQEKQATEVPAVPRRSLGGAGDGYIGKRDDRWRYGGQRERDR